MLRAAVHLDKLLPLLLLLLRMRLLSRCLPVLQGMYLLLVTNKASNILEDLETLRLMSKVLPEYVLPPVDEESIIGAAFELLFAFDEVISLGYKENVTVGQVKQNTEMESHEEKLHKMIIQSKVQDTKVRRSCSHSPQLSLGALRCIAEQEFSKLLAYSMIHDRGYTDVT